MRQAALLLLAFFIYSYAAGQGKEITLKGYLGVEGGESFSYNLVFKDSLGFIRGYSVTWLQEGKDVKAIISGTIDRKNQRLSFREEKIVYNHGFSSRTTICLIQATLQYSSEGGKIMLSGPIYSSDASNAYCGKGSINISGNDVVEQLFAEPKKDTVTATKPIQPSVPKKPMRIIYDTATAPVQTAPVKGPDKITSGMDKVYEWTSDTVVIDIWDGGQIDGDMITVSYNNKTVLQRYVLTKLKTQLRLPVPLGEIQTITITANNEGNDPPNTANLMLTDGSVQHPVIAYNTIGRQAVIKIKRKQ